MIIKEVFLDILVIYSHKTDAAIIKSSFLINLHGGYDKVNFKFDDSTGVDKSCSLQWHNHYYIFGGWTTRLEQQVSMVNGYRLERKGSFNFKFHNGACTVLNQKTIVLCFDDDEKDVCRQSNNPLGIFTKLPNSNFDHVRTRIASFDGKNTSC